MSRLVVQQWLRLRDRVAQQFGLYLDESRQNQGCSIVERHAQERNLPILTYYAHLLSSAGAHDLYLFAEEIANHETQFLRNPAHFRALREQLFPLLDTLRAPQRPLRCWSAGCSSGEEPYGIAMTALLAFGVPPRRKMQIWGTDLSSDVLERARQGVYRGRTLNNLQPDYRRWFDTQSDGRLRVSEMVRSLVQFEQHNLLHPWPDWAHTLDIIFCQNVTIYFQLATCKRLIEQMYAALAEGGYLLLGFSESLWGIFDGFETIELDGAFVYRKGTAAGGRHQPHIAAAPAPKPHIAAPQWPIRRITRVTTPAPSKPESSTTLMQQAQELRSVGQQRAALKLLAKVAPDQRTPALLALTAQLHADLGEHESAAAEARRALELDVMQDAAYVVLGVLEVQHGAWVEGARLLERAQYLNPHAPLVSFYLAESYRHQGRTNDAQREYRNTMRKLQGKDRSSLIDGVAVGWLIDTCQRWLDTMEKQKRDS